MKDFRITYLTPEREEFMEILSFPSEIIAKSELRKFGVDITDIYEVKRNKDLFERIQDYWYKNFATRTYSVKVECAFLRAFKIAIQDGFTEEEALQKTKSVFPKSNKVIRTIIDEMIETLRKGGISELYDLFRAHEEIFSRSFLTTMREARAVKTGIEKIISNPVDKDKRGREMEGYVELTESIHELQQEIVKSITGPIIYTVFLLIFTFSILQLGVPRLFKALSKFIPHLESVDFSFIGNSTLATSEFLGAFGLYILGIVFAALAVCVFLYKTNFEIRRSMEIMLLKSPIVGEIITVFFTKKIVSIFGIFNEAGMRPYDNVGALIDMTPFIPMKEELSILQKDIASKPYAVIFASYPDEEKYFTEAFYASLSTDGDRGYVDRSVAFILKNVDDLWENMKGIPQKIGAWIKYGGMGVAGYFIVGLLFIVSFATTSAV